MSRVTASSSGTMCVGGCKRVSPLDARLLYFLHPLLLEFRFSSKCLDTPRSAHAAVLLPLRLLLAMALCCDSILVERCVRPTFGKQDLFALVTKSRWHILPSRECTRGSASARWRRVAWPCWDVVISRPHPRSGCGILVLVSRRSRPAPNWCHWRVRCEAVLLGVVRPRATLCPLDLRVPAVGGRPRMSHLQVAKARERKRPQLKRFEELPKAYMSSTLRDARGMT